MKIKTNKQKIESGVQKASRVANKHLTLPVLSCVYLEALASGKLVIKSTNLDVGIEIELEVKTVEQGVAAVPAQIFLNVLSSIKEDEITIETKDNNILISSNKNSATIKCLPYEDFPTIPILESSNVLQINSRDLLAGFKSVWYSASVSAIKPELSSVFLYKDGENLVFASTDSFRLAEKKVHNSSNVEIPQLLIPSKNVSEIIKLFEDLGDDINVVFEKNQIAFIAKDIYLVSRLVEGNFPDYKQIIPKNFTSSVTVLKNDFINSIKTSNIFSDTLHQVKLSVVPNEKALFVESKNNDVGEYKESINASITGDALELNFNNKYIIDCMQSIVSDSIVLNFAGMGKPLLIEGVSKNGFSYIVMPMNR